MSELKYKMAMVDIENWLNETKQKPSEVIVKLLDRTNDLQAIKVACAISQDPESAYLRLGISERTFYRKLKEFGLSGRDLFPKQSVTI